MLGTGAFGSVRLVHDKTTKKLLALKALKRRNINKYLESEIVNHSLLRWATAGHPGSPHVPLHACSSHARAPILHARTCTHQGISTHWWQALNPTTTTTPAPATPPLRAGTRTWSSSGRCS